jgi:hypothetical protein
MSERKVRARSKTPTKSKRRSAAKPAIEIEGDGYYFRCEDLEKLQASINDVQQKCPNNEEDAIDEDDAMDAFAAAADGVGVNRLREQLSDGGWDDVVMMLLTVAFIVVVCAILDDIDQFQEWLSIMEPSLAMLNSMVVLIGCATLVLCACAYHYGYTLVISYLLVFPATLVSYAEEQQAKLLMVFLLFSFFSKVKYVNELLEPCDWETFQSYCAPKNHS